MKSIKTLLLALAVLFAAPAMAGSFSGTVVSVVVKTSGVTYVSMSGSTGHGSCSGTSIYWAIKDETSVAGKAQLALLAAAHSTGATVVVYGVNTCTRVSGVEDLDEVDLL